MVLPDKNISFDRKLYDGGCHLNVLKGQFFTSGGFQGELNIALMAF